VRPSARAISTCSAGWARSTHGAAIGARDKYLQPQPSDGAAIGAGDPQRVLGTCDKHLQRQPSYGAAIGACNQQFLHPLRAAQLHALAPEAVTYG